MSDGEVRLMREGAVATVIFDRPAARNAMTWQMYEQLKAACDTIRDDPRMRVAVFRGAGGKAFVAGTDISQFLTFQSGEDGMSYEQRMEGYLDAIESLSIPTLAVVEGWAIGGGLAIASVCDLRIATPGSRFGVPIARTLGNCLSIANYARIVTALGPSNAKRMLLLAEMISAEEALSSGFVLGIVAAADLDRRVAELCERLAGNARSPCGSARKQSDVCSTRDCQTVPTSCAAATAARIFGSAYGPLSRSASRSGRDDEFKTSGLAEDGRMDTQELGERGLKLRREMFGDKAVEQRMNAFGEFGAPLQNIINAYAYGDIWSRPAVPMATKSLAMIAMMAASGRANELRVHLKGALKNGCTAEEIREILLLVALYCGIPAANEAHQAAVEVLAETERR
jgi:enoyl-CoA hydratase